MTRDKPLILIVDDDPKLIHLVREVLQAVGFKVLASCSGEHAVETVALENPDLVLLTFGNFDGFEVARRIREFSEVPIIMLTAKVKETDLLRGFEVGADDYITKPFSSRELLVRVRALLKRAQTAPTAQAEAEFICGDLYVNFASHRVKVGDREVRLTATEFKLLSELAKHCDQVLLHEQLLSAVWGPEYRDDIDYLRSYIRYLRRKIEPEPANPKFVVTSGLSPNFGLPRF